MKSVLRNNQIILLAVLLIFGAASVNAQVTDFIGEQIRQAAKNKVDSIVSTSVQTTGADAQSGLSYMVKEELQRYETFPVSTSELLSIDSKYGLSGDQTDYSNVYQTQADLTDSYVHGLKNIKMGALGQGSVITSGKEYVDSVQTAATITSLSSALTQNALDSVDFYSKEQPNLKELLLEDIQGNDNLQYIINSHPGTIKVYSHLLQSPDFRKSCSQLLYWAVQASTYYNCLPKKHDMPDPRSLTFVPGDNSITVMDGERSLGVVSLDGKLTCTNLDLLNMRPMPNMCYVLDNMMWRTDPMGRVYSITQVQGDELKQKCKYKSRVKGKNFESVLSTKEIDDEFIPVNTKYGAPDVLMDIFYIAKTDDNKQGLKDLKVIETGMLKTNDKCTRNVMIKYRNGGPIPEKITIDFSGSYESVILSNNIEQKQ